MWDDIIGEPDGIKSTQCAWNCSYKCFRGTRNCCYILLTTLFAPCLAFCSAINFACLAFQVTNEMAFFHFRRNSLCRGHVSIRNQEKTSHHFFITKNTFQAHHSRPFQANHAQKCQKKKSKGKRKLFPCFSS